ncbi:MAG: hypothetical protein JWM47_4533 [Acidimicrobiales bacterium]|nr:hypothetical protein [Acidimicrobiales bacterium]
MPGPRTAAPQSLGYLSLRSDFGLDPTMAVGSLTTAIQAAINTAVAAGKGIDVGNDLWPINAALTIGGSISIQGVGAGEVWDTVAHSSQTQMPGAAPWVKGGGFVQKTAATNILNITATGPCVHLRDLVLSFDSAIAFNNTGHGVYGVASTLLSGKPENGPAGCLWENIVVFGHDGNHYAFYTVNMNLFTAIQLRSYGGGGWYEECNTGYSTNYGNGTIVEPYFCVVAGGTADGFYFKSMNPFGSPNGVLNLVTMIRPQANMVNPTGTQLAAAFTIATPSSTNQKMYRDVGNPAYFNLISPDFEGVWDSAFTVTYGNGTIISGVELSPQINYNNTTFGRNAMAGSRTGVVQNNTAIGFNALNAQTTGASNTAVGSKALQLATTGPSNTAIGYSTLAALVTGANNTALGFQALAANTADSNTALGWNALAVSTTATGCTAVGSGTLRANVVGGNNNTAVGSGALTASTSGASNTAVGANSLSTQTTGANNTAVGFNAMLSNTSGVTNTAVGYEALKANTTGANNVAVGQSALLVATSNNNTAVGLSALSANTNGDKNTAVGTNAGKSNTTGAANVAVGHNAGSTDGTTATSVGLSNTTLLGQNAQATVGRVVVLGSALTGERASLALGCVGSATNLGSGVGALIALNNADTVPSANHPSGGQLYAEGGALKWRGSSGTVSTLAVA